MVLRRPATAFSTSPRRLRHPRVTSEKHLEWIRTLPCIIKGTRLHVEAAHVRYHDRRFGKRETGMGEKPDDRWTVPLCSEKHRTDKDAQHQGSELKFWRAYGLDPVLVACALWGCSGDDELAEIILTEARANARSFE